VCNSLINIALRFLGYIIVIMRHCVVMGANQLCVLAGAPGPGYPLWSFFRGGASLSSLNVPYSLDMIFFYRKFFIFFSPRGLKNDG